MKYFILTIVFLLGVSISASAQNSTKVPKEKPKMELKNHQCTTACHNAGHCVYVHGEKGHKCTDKCESMKNNSMNDVLKNHQCTNACQDTGHCVYVHGEKGHKCTDDCKKKM